MASSTRGSEFRGCAVAEVICLGVWACRAKRVNESAYVMSIAAPSVDCNQVCLLDGLTRSFLLTCASSG